MSKLLNNLPVEDLTEENDYLGIIDKGQIIKTFVESNTDEFKDIKMFALYGEWGSGKSTLMKYLQKELKGTFNTFFFEAWEFESDSNLSLSLLEFLIKNSDDSTEQALGEIYKTASKLFKGFVKSTKVTFPMGITNITVDGSKVLEANKKKTKSFLELKDDFKTKFRKWEDNKTPQKSNEFNIIFIDDLDRCEPENVLNLLSALKLFFTYGEKTIFFCGIDKKAVKEAVKTKYGEVVKANEYLEKIFDISFSMPEYDDLLKLVSQFFDSREVGSVKGALNENISNFFKALNFTNPRRVKKVLNKYSIIQSLSYELGEEHKYSHIIPNIITKESGNYFETILTLHLIILHEFFPKLFEKLFDLGYKVSYLSNIIRKSTIDGSFQSYVNTLDALRQSNLVGKKISSIRFNNNAFQEFIFSFLPNNVIQINVNSYHKDTFPNIKVSHENIEHKFIQYVLKNESILSFGQDFSNLSMLEMKSSIAKIL